MTENINSKDCLIQQGKGFFYMLKMNDKPYQYSVLLHTLIVIFFVEIIIMLAFNVIKLEFSVYLLTLFDALLLSILSTPILFLCSI